MLPPGSDEVDIVVVSFVVLSVVDVVVVLFVIINLVVDCVV